MFNQAISAATLTSEAAGRLFSNITACDAPDQSFLATLRALLRNRLPPDETARLVCKVLHLSEAAVSAAPVSEVMGWVLPETALYPAASEYNISIVYTAQPAAGEKLLEVIRANAGDGRRYMPSYRRQEDLRIFYARRLNALFYTDNRNTVIFAAGLELKHFHALQMMVSKYLPGLFTLSPLTETEKALLKSTGNKSSAEYETLIEEFAKDLDIRAELIRGKLAGFEMVFEREKANDIRNEIGRLQSDYDSNLDILRELSQKIENCRYTLAGLESAISERSGDSELMEYFMCSRNLSLIRVTGPALEFVAHGYADIYDQDAFEQYAGNLGGYMYSNLDPAVTKAQMEKLYRSVFSEGRYRLRMCAAYTADMNTGLRAFKQYSFPAESRTYLPNPHIQHFGCIGTYAGRFQEYMRKKDYVGAIDQAVVSARNLNFYDSSVISTFARELSHTSVRCMEKPDGSLLTPREAITELEGGTVPCQDPLF